MLILSSMIAFAQSPPKINGLPAKNIGPVDRDELLARKAKEKAEIEYKMKRPDQIWGRCLIRPARGFSPYTCGGLTLMLSDGKTLVQRVKVDQGGGFVFRVRPERKYKILVLENNYSVMFPAGFVTTGKQSDVFLMEKQ